MSRTRKLLIWLAALLATALVFMSYFNPNLVFSLATQLWNCF